MAGKAAKALAARSLINERFQYKKKRQRTGTGGDSILWSTTLPTACDQADAPFFVYSCVRLVGLAVAATYSMTARKPWRGGGHFFPDMSKKKI